MNYYFKGIRNGQVYYVELEKYRSWTCILIKWGINGEIIDDERINTEDVESLEEKGLYQVIEKKAFYSNLMIIDYWQK